MRRFQIFEGIVVGVPPLESPCSPSVNLAFFVELCTQFTDVVFNTTLRVILFYIVLNFVLHYLIVCN